MERPRATATSTFQPGTTCLHRSLLRTGAATLAALLLTSAGARADEPPMQGEPAPLDEKFMADAAEAEEAPPAEDLLRPMSPKIVITPFLGLGGDVEGSDLAPGFGLAAHYEHPLHEIFVLGALVSAQSWITKTANTLGLDRAEVVDLSLLPKLRFAANERLELYVAAPIGLTMDFVDGRTFAGSGSDTGFGWNLHALLGGQFAIIDGVGLAGDVGYVRHTFTHSFSGVGDFDAVMQQFRITAGVFIAL